MTDKETFCVLNNLAATTIEDNLTTAEDPMSAEYDYEIYPYIGGIAGVVNNDHVINNVYIGEELYIDESDEPDTYNDIDLLGFFGDFLLYLEEREYDMGEYILANNHGFADGAAAIPIVATMNDVTPGELASGTGGGLWLAAALMLDHAKEVYGEDAENIDVSYTLVRLRTWVEKGGMPRLGAFYSAPAPSPYIPPSPPAPPVQTIPAEEGVVDVPYTEQGGAAGLQLPSSKTDEILAAAQENGSDTADFDLSQNTDVTKATAETKALETLVEAGLGLEFNFAGGSAALDPEAAADILAQAEGDTLEIKVEELPEVSQKELNSQQIGTLAVGDTVYDVSVISNGVEIHEFAGTIRVTVPYTGKLPVKAWFMGERGKSERIDGVYDPVTNSFSFIVPHLSMWVIGHEETPWPFTDVIEDDSVNWFYSDVKFVWETGLMLGTSGTLFSPYLSTTRGMIAAILYRLEGSPKTSDNHTDFSDVSESAYYHDAVAWAASNAIVLGYGNGKYGPEDNITREQLAAILYRYATYKAYKTTSTTPLDPYSDAPEIDEYALIPMQWAVETGLIQGRSATLLAPNGTAKRAEVAAIFHRFIENVAGVK
jgi:hypothetical protein